MLQRFRETFLARGVSKSYISIFWHLQTSTFGPVLGGFLGEFGLESNKLNFSEYLHTHYFANKHFSDTLDKVWDSFTVKLPKQQLFKSGFRGFLDYPGLENSKVDFSGCLDT